MDLGRQCAHIGIRALPIEGHEKEKLLLLWSEQDNYRSDGWIPIYAQVDSGEYR